MAIHQTLVFDAGSDPPKSSTTPVHRTRQDQREDSRRRLLYAAVDCLVAKGYSGTTTSAIAQRSGLSQGAIFSHFASKADLLAAVVGEVFQWQVGKRIEEMIRSLHSHRPIAEVIDMVWAATDVPESLALQELYTAARRVPALSVACQEVETIIRHHNLELATMLYPDMVDNPRFFDAIELIYAAARGAALIRTAFGDAEHDQSIKRSLIDALEQLLLSTVPDSERRGDEPHHGSEVTPSHNPTGALPTG